VVSEPVQIDGFSHFKRRPTIDDRNMRRQSSIVDRQLVNDLNPEAARGTFDRRHRAFNVD
jgi:hypothetical protein